MQELTELFLKRWLEAESFVMPKDLDDCIKFIVSESVEAMDALMRVDDPYKRNNPRQVSLDNVDEEVADVIFMAIVYFIMRGKSAAIQLETKLEIMNDDRN